MRRHKIVTRALVILFIVVNFVFCAPVAAREKPEEVVDVDVAEDRTAVLQKRVNPVDEASTNMADQSPSIPDKTEADQLWKKMREQGMPIDSSTPLHTRGWSTPPFSEDSSPESNRESLSPEGSTSGSLATHTIDSRSPVDGRTSSSEPGAKYTAESGTTSIEPAATSSHGKRGAGG